MNGQEQRTGVGRRKLSQTWNEHRGRLRQRRGEGHQRLLLERGTNPSGTHHCQQFPVLTGSRHPRSAASKARTETVVEATSTSDTPYVHERSLPRPEDERAVKQTRVGNTSPPDPGGASSSSTAAASSTLYRPVSDNASEAN